LTVLIANKTCYVGLPNLQSKHAPGVASSTLEAWLGLLRNYTFNVYCSHSNIVLFINEKLSTCCLL